MIAGVMVSLLDILVVFILERLALEALIAGRATRTLLALLLVLVGLLGLVRILALAVRCGWTSILLCIWVCLISLFPDKLAHVTDRTQS